MLSIGPSESVRRALLMILALLLALGAAASCSFDAAFVLEITNPCDHGITVEHWGSWEGLPDTSTPFEESFTVAAGESVSFADVHSYSGAIYSVAIRIREMDLEFSFPNVVAGQVEPVVLPADLCSAAR